MRILVVDDESEMATLVARGLGAEGHEVHTALNGLEALSLAHELPFDAAVLDVMMPGMTGFELCRWLKGSDPQIMVVLLTARDAVDDRIRGLDEGADDYLVKPFAMAELIARIRAIHRRDVLSPQRHISLGNIDLDLFAHRAEVERRTVPLSRTEFDVLRALVTAECEVVARPALFEAVWGSAANIDPNILDQYVSYLRRKLRDKRANCRIDTVRGVGYRLQSITEEVD